MPSRKHQRFRSLGRERGRSVGLRLKERENTGRTELLLVRDGMIEAVGDKRGDDSAAGY